VKEFVGRELHIFKRYQVDINDINVSHGWFFDLPNIKHYRTSNWNKEIFVFWWHINKFKEILFTNDKFAKVDICEQNLTEWYKSWLRITFWFGGVDWKEPIIRKKIRTIWKFIWTWWSCEPMKLWKKKDFW
jgi:hypothetical protein